MSAGEPQDSRWLLARLLSLVALARFSSAHLAFSSAAALNRLASPCLQSTLVTDLLRAGRRNGGAPAGCQWCACASSNKIPQQPRGAGPRGADQCRGLHVLQLIFDPLAICWVCCTCENGDINTRCCAPLHHLRCGWAMCGMLTRSRAQLLAAKTWLLPTA